jgi:hypothetical protein
VEKGTISRDIIDEVDLHLSLTHEHVHWTQHHGTTVGSFLSLLRFTQQRTTISWLAKLPSPVKKQLESLRRSVGVPSIVALKPSGERIVDPSRNSTLEMTCQIWHDQLLSHSVIENSAHQDQIGWPRGEVFGEIVGDALLYACEECGLGTYPGNAEARRWYHFDDSELKFVAVNGERLTTRALMEGMATANEIQALLFFPQVAKSEPLVKRLQQTLDSFYGVAWRALVYSLGDAPRAWPRLIPTLNVLCELALDPPLPPLVMAPPLTGAHWPWEDIYPPLRFMQLLKAVKRIGLLDVEYDHSMIEYYIRSLCDDLMWPCPLDFEHPLSSSIRRFDFAHMDPAEEDRMWYHDYLLWVQSKMWALKKTNLPFFTNFGQHTSGRLNEHYYFDTHSAENDTKYWLRPPFLRTPDERLAYIQDRTFIDWLLLSTLAYYLLFDVMVGVGDYDLSAFPAEVVNSKATLERVFAALSRGMDLDLFPPTC